MEIWMLWLSLLIFPCVIAIALLDWCIFGKMQNKQWYSYYPACMFEVFCYLSGFCMGLLSYKLIIGGI